MSERLVRDKWLIAAARFEGIIDAHKILKDGKGDYADELLWKMAADIAAEVDSE
jgi:hypothetical protein